MISKILRLVGDKLSAFKLLVFICIGAIIELLSIGALLPAIFLISNQSDNPILNFLKKFFNELNPKLDESNFAYTVLILLIFLFLIKFLYLTFLSYYQATFALNLQVKLSNFFLKKYLKAKHQFHINNNSAIMIRNVMSEVNIFYKHIFTPLMISILEIIIAAAMVIFLLFYNPTTTIIILAIMILLFLLYFFQFKKKFFGWGKDRLYHDGIKLKNLKESLDFVKLIKFMKKEEFFLKKFKLHNMFSALVSRKFSVMFVIPRLFLEFFLVLIVATIGTFFIYKGATLNYFFETATVYITIAYRLIPSLTRLSTNFQAISGSKPSLDTLIKIYDSNELTDDEINFNQNEVKKINFNKTIELEDLSFKYENKTEATLENLNFKINKGEFIGIIGDTGAGKSTLVDILLGIFKPTSGKIKVDGLTIDKNLILNYGYVPQESFILDESITNNIAFGEENKNINHALIQEVIKISKIDKFINNLPEGLETVLSERGENLSGGQTQRISIARALYFNPDILILDEATSALDLKTEGEFLKDLLNLKKYKTIILISHRKESMIYCDNIYELRDKKIFLKK